MYKMKISINTRLLREKYHTGIQSYISNLYESVKLIDKNNEYIFLKGQSENNRLTNAIYNNFLVRNEIKKAKADIFHATNSILPLGPKVCHYVSTIYDMGFKSIPRWSPKTELAYYDFAFKNIVQKADLIVAISSFTKNEIKKYYKIDESRLAVVPLGIDNFYLKKETDSYLDEIRNKYNLVNQKTIFINSAHSNRKNTDSIIKVFTENHDYFKDKCLVICGAVGKTTFQNLLSSRDNNIILTGYVPKKELRALYQIVDVFIYPSLYEGFGLPLLEAMASNCPILASNIPPVREIISNKDLLFDPLDLKEIYEKIKNCLNLEVEEKHALLDSYKSILERFTWSRAAEKMINIFNLF